MEANQATDSHHKASTALHHQEDNTELPHQEANMVDLRKASTALLRQVDSSTVTVLRQVGSSMEAARHSMANSHREVTARRHHHVNTRILCEVEKRDHGCMVIREQGLWS
jgi:ABC-type Fe2+-enterobactin transport system substrate-binding protein